MRKSLFLKLTLAFVLVAFITTGLVAVLIRATSVDRLSRLRVDQQRDRLQEVLASYYSSAGSWEGISENWRDIQTFSSRSLGFGGANGMHQGQQAWMPPGMMMNPDQQMFGLADAQGVVLVSVDANRPVNSVLTARQVRTGMPVVVNQQTVGTILTARGQLPINPSEALFLERTTLALIFAMLGALLVALIVGVWLSRNLTRPLQALTTAARNIAAGDLNQQVVITSTDEIGELADAFNRMSQEVSNANLLRQQMTADIAHDLRTPLTVIAGYIESMRDGVLQPTPQRMTVIYSEIERLQHLVSDLLVLSQADAGALPLIPQAIDPNQLLQQAAQAFQHNAEKHGVIISVEGMKTGAIIYVDEARMLQVLDNLISNALRFTSPGGTITLSAMEKPGKVELSVKDTGSGIPADVLPNIFNRFLRGETSRHSDVGESGLGLSIVKAFVEAQNGRVRAESTEGVGTTIYIEFPLANHTAKTLNA